MGGISDVLSALITDDPSSNRPTGRPAIDEGGGRHAMQSKWVDRGGPGGGGRLAAAGQEKSSLVALLQVVSVGRLAARRQLPSLAFIWQGSL
jgi:hypothetical protein